MPEKEHTDVILLHEQILKQNVEDIKELKEITFGLPQTLERIEYVVSELGNNFKEFLRSADKKYQTKEMCDMCRNDIDKRITELEKKNDRLQWGVLSALALVIWEIIKSQFLK